MSIAELSDLRSQVELLMMENRLRTPRHSAQKMAEMVEAPGMSLEPRSAKGRKGKGSVAAKYRDPKNPENTWTGRGRMPLWMVPPPRATRPRRTTS